VAWSRAQQAKEPAAAATASAADAGARNAGAASPAGSGSGAGGGAAAGAAPPGGGIQHDEGAHKFFVLAATGQEARLTYTLTPGSGGSGGIMDLRHTFVPDSFRGQGTAGRLATTACEFAASRGLSIVPTCSYIRDTFLPSTVRAASGGGERRTWRPHLSVYQAGGCAASGFDQEGLNVRHPLAARPIPPGTRVPVARQQERRPNWANLKANSATGNRPEPKFATPCPALSQNIHLYLTSC
jgi:predicted GNAT family acetyltransferase